MKFGSLVAVTSFLLGCASPIVLGTPGAPDGSDPAIDAGAGARDASEARAPRSSHGAELCGFRFEREAEGYTHLWASGPADQWLVRNMRQLDHFDGRRTAPVALPADLEARDYWIHRLDGSRRGRPWLLIGYWPTSHSRHYVLLHRRGDQWDRVELPPGLASPSDGTLDDFVVLRDDDVWAASEATGGRTPATLYRWDGRSWTTHTFDGAWPFGLSRVGTDEVAFAFSGRSPDGTNTQYRRGSAGDWQPLSPVPSHAVGARGPILFHASHLGSELFVDSAGRVWDAAQRAWTAVVGEPSRVLSVGYYDGAYWVIKPRVALRLVDPRRPTLVERYALPFEAAAAAFPAQGPPWIVGEAKAFWNGTGWETQGAHLPHLYRRMQSVWGQSGDDYWLTTDAGVIHLHGGISEHRLGPPDCGAARVTSAFGLANDDLFLTTCHGVQRFHGGRWREVVLEAPAQVAGLDERRLWAFTAEHSYRFDYDRFVVEGPDSWAAGAAERSRWMVPTPVASDATALYAGMLDDTYAARVAQFRDGEWTVLPHLPGGAGGPHERPWFTQLHSDGRRLWVVGYERTSPVYATTRAWAWDGEQWEHADLPHRPTTAWHRYIAGRGDALWVVASDRTIWRRQPDGQWQRDDRCVDAPALGGVSFEGVWFPPDGSPPKVFATGGNILVYEEELL